MNNENENKYQPEIDTSALETGVQRAETILTGIGDAAVAENARLESVMVNIGSVTEKALDTSLVNNLVKEVSRLDSMLEQVFLKLYGVLGSTQEASELLRELQAYSLDNIFGFGELAESTVKLLELGHTASEVLPLLDTLSNISVGTDASLEEWIEAYSHIREGDSLDATAISEWAGLGINLMQELAQMFKVTEEQIGKMVAAGQVGFTDMVRLLNEMTQGTGTYAKAMEEQMKGIRSSMENLQATVVELVNQLASARLAPGKENTESVQELESNYRKVITALEDFNTVSDSIKTLLAVTEAVNGMTGAANILSVAKTKLTAVTTGLNAVMKAGIYGAIAAAIVALTYLIYKWVSSTNEAEAANKRLNEATKEFNRNAASEQVQIKTLFREFEKATEGTKEYEKAKKNILDRYGNYLKGLDDETRSLKNIAGAYEAVSKAALEAARSRQMEKVTSEAADEYGEIYAKNIALLQSYYYKRYKDPAKAKDKFERLKADLDQGKNYDALPKEVREEGYYIIEYINNIADAYANYNRQVRVASALFGSVSTPETQLPMQDPKAMANQLTGEIKALEKQLAELRTTSSQNVLEEIKATETLLSEKRKNLELLTGKTAVTGFTGKSAEPKDPGMEAEEKRQAEQAAKDAELFAANAAKREEMAYRQAQLELRQQKLDIQEDSYQKQHLQLQLNHEKELLAIDQRTQELIEHNQRAQRAYWEASGGEGLFTPEVRERKDLSTGMHSDLGAMDIQADDNLQKGTEELYSQLIRELRQYLADREQVEKEYEDRIAAIRKDKKLKTEEEITAAMAEAAGKKQEQLAGLEQKMSDPLTLLGDLFDATSNQVLTDIQTITQEAEELLKLLKNGEWDVSIESRFHINEEQFKNLAADQKELEKIEKGIGTVSSAANQAQNAFGKMSDGLKKIFSAGDDKEKLTSGIELLNEGMTTATKLAGKVGEGLKSIGAIAGNDMLGGIADGIGDIMDIAGGALSGAEAGAAFGPIGAAIGAAVGLASTLTGKLAENAAHRKMLREQIRKNQMEDYLAEMEINRLWRERYEWAQKIGESTLSYIKRQGEELDKQTAANAKEQEELMAKLLGTEYKSNEYFKKTGLFGWGKGKIVEEWSSLAGKSWDEIELLAAQGKLSEDGQKYYEALKAAREEGEDLAQRQEEYLEMVRETFAGSTYDSVVNSIVEGFKAGKRSADDFAETFEELMENAVVASLKLLTDEKMRKWYESFASKAQDGLTDKDIEVARQEYMELVEQLAKEAEALEKVTGIAIGEAERTAATKGIATASQESVDELNGRFTAIQAHTYNINENVQVLATNSSTVLKHLAGIETNTQHCQRLETIQSDMEAVKYELKEMNLKGITLKKS